MPIRVSFNSPSLESRISNGLFCSLWFHRFADASFDRDALSCCTDGACSRR
jgi:hypothetical protein